jgi:chemotaxis protein MotB
VANLIRGNEHRVMVEGHIDDVPIRTAQFRANWELSTARAIAVMGFLVENDVDSSRVALAGYAELRSLEPNDTSEHRAENRRVEFVFTSSDVTG